MIHKSERPFNFTDSQIEQLKRAPASATRIRCPFRSSTDVGYIDKRIVAAAAGANGSHLCGRLDVRVFF
jgi:hypothetical protein